MESQEELKFAGFWIRLVAFVTDLVPFVLIAILYGAMEMLKVTGGYENILISWFTGSAGKGFATIFITIYGFYLMIAEGIKPHATPGQRLCRLCVVDKNTKNGIGILRAILRFWVCRFLWFINVFSIPFTKEKIGIHDFLTGSRVVYARR